MRSSAEGARAKLRAGQEVAVVDAVCVRPGSAPHRCVLLLLLAPCGAGSTAGAARPLTVMLDPGHGGHEHRSVRARGGAAREAAHPRALPARRARLAGSARLRVQLTRTRDEYLTLAERVRRANAQPGAALHQRARQRLRGAQPQRLRELHPEPRRLGPRGRPAGAAGEQQRGGRRRAARGGGALRAILADLQQSAAHAASLRLAAGRAAPARPRCAAPSANRGVRQAPFDVLMGLRMPAVLVEVGYLDHPLEGPELRQAAVQERIAAAIAAAVRDHWLGPQLSEPRPSEPRLRPGAAPRANR